MFFDKDGMDRTAWVIRYLYNCVNSVEDREIYVYLNIDRGWWYRNVFNCWPSFKWIMRQMEKNEMVEKQVIPYVIGGVGYKMTAYRLTDGMRETLKMMKEIRDDVRTL